ncbi:hypothetical protein Tco_0664579 [Tanacetum coccineum]
MDGPYQTNPPSPNDIISSIQIDKEGQVHRIRHEEEIDVLEYQILTRENVPTLKSLEEIIRENVFCLGSYVLYNRVMNPLTAQQEQKTRKDHGMRRDVPPRPLNPQPLQSHPSLDITLSLSSITPLDHILDTPSPSPPQPQPPIMGHPLYYNYYDYHGSTCICFSYNQTLFLTLRDEMHIMFAHLEYLLTTAITSHFPPSP